MINHSTSPYGIIQHNSSFMLQARFPRDDSPAVRCDHKTSPLEPRHCTTSVIVLISALYITHWTRSNEREVPKVITQPNFFFFSELPKEKEEQTVARFQGPCPPSTWSRIPNLRPSRTLLARSKRAGKKKTAIHARRGHD